jgi:hypothetical protein
MAAYRFVEIVDKLKAQLRNRSYLKPASTGLHSLRQARVDELLQLEEGSLDITGQVCGGSIAPALKGSCCRHILCTVAWHIQETIRVLGHVVLKDLVVRLDVNTKNPEHKRLYELQGNPLDNVVSQRVLSG